jgi:hydroxymethylglutaryl-CoA lyase
VREAGLRDGPQIHATFMPTDSKIARIEAEAAAAVGKIEAGSYVPPTQQPFPLPRHAGRQINLLQP